MANRNFNKKLAIALGVLIGGTGTLNAIPVSAMEGDQNNKNDYEYMMRNIKSLALDMVNNEIINEQLKGASFAQALDSVKNKIPRLIKTELSVDKNEFAALGFEINWYYAKLNPNFAVQASFLAEERRQKIIDYLNSLLDQYSVSLRKKKVCNIQ